MKTHGEIIAQLIIGVLIILSVGLLFSLPVWLLWNLCLVPAIDGVHTIGWFQAFGLIMLFQLLFKLKVERNG